MAYLGEVTLVEDMPDEDGDGLIRHVQTEVTEPDDMRSFIELVRHAGVDYNPRLGSQVFVFDVAGGYEIATACDDMVPPETEPGEYEIYATDEENAKTAKIRVMVDGTTRINDGEDWAVRYSMLEEAFNQLKSDFNTLVSTFDNHVHPGVTAGGASTAATATAGTASAADITPAKVATVLLPTVEQEEE